MLNMIDRALKLLTREQQEKIYKQIQKILREEDNHAITIDKADLKRRMTELISIIDDSGGSGKQIDKVRKFWYVTGIYALVHFEHFFTNFVTEYDLNYRIDVEKVVNELFTEEVFKHAIRSLPLDVVQITGFIRGFYDKEYYVKMLIEKDFNYVIEFGMKFIKSEYTEIIAAIDGGDREEVKEELVDLILVTYPLLIQIAVIEDKEQGQVEYIENKIKYNLLKRMKIV